jgi:hypothetical protein
MGTTPAERCGRRLLPLPLGEGGSGTSSAIALSRDDAVARSADTERHVGTECIVDQRFIELGLELCVRVYDGWLPIAGSSAPLAEGVSMAGANRLVDS